MRTKFTRNILLGTLLTNLSFGYLDPGTGSFILQILVAGLLGIGLSIKLFWRQIVNVFKPSKRVEQDDDTVTQ